MTEVDPQVVKALAFIALHRLELASLLEEARSIGVETANERLKRWKSRTVSMLRSHVHQSEAENLSLKQPGRAAIVGSSSDPFRQLFGNARIYDSFLAALEADIKQHPDAVFQAPLPAAPQDIEVQVPDVRQTGSVFIVHGHDELNRLRLKELLREKWQLDPVVMANQPGQGRTLIEKFEEEAQDVAFAIVLMTPDDLVQLDGDEYLQARPNVIFELGWFYGQLGRERVCIMCKRGTNIHSDLAGVSRIEFDESVRECTDKLEVELLAAGVLTN